MAAQSVEVATRGLVSKAQGREEGEEVSSTTKKAVRNLSSHTCLVRCWPALLPEENMKGQVRGRNGTYGCCETERELCSFWCVCQSSITSSHFDSPHHHFSHLHHLTLSLSHCPSNTPTYIISVPHFHSLTSQPDILTTSH